MPYNFSILLEKDLPDEKILEQVIIEYFGLKRNRTDIFQDIVSCKTNLGINDELTLDFEKYSLESINNLDDATTFQLQAFSAAAYRFIKNLEKGNNLLQEYKVEKK